MISNERSISSIASVRRREVSAITASSLKHGTMIESSGLRPNDANCIPTTPDYGIVSRQARIIRYKASPASRTKVRYRPRQGGAASALKSGHSPGRNFEHVQAVVQDTLPRVPQKPVVACRVLQELPRQMRCANHDSSGCPVILFQRNITDSVPGRILQAVVGQMDDLVRVLGLVVA